MADLLARFFAPRIVELTAQVQELGQAAKFWELRYHEELKLRRQAEERLDTESVANREREDLLLNEALRGAGREGVPTREGLKEREGKKGQDDTDNGIDEATQKILEARAQEMAGEDATEEQIAEVMKKLMLNPEYWATN